MPSPDSPQPQLPWKNLLDALGLHQRTKTAAALGATALALMPFVQQVKAWQRERSVYRITVPGTDDIYPDLHEWVLSLLPPRDRRALVAETAHITSGPTVDENSVPFDPNPPESPPIRLRYDGSRRQTVVLDGHRVTVSLERDSDISAAVRERLPANWRRLLESVVFTVTSEAGRDAVIRHLNELVRANQLKPGLPPLLMPRWGAWERRNDLPPRSIDSVILKKGQLDTLVADMEHFLAAEPAYNRANQPWHRGYLFWGPPGTGKTTVARALAHRFQLAVYYLPLGDLESDTNLIDLISRVPARSMLLIEDVDVFSATTQRKENGSKKTTTLSAILNSLDGIWTPHGLISVLTTNHREALDAAIVRPGRIDVSEEFTNLDLPQAQEIVKWFGDDAHSCQAEDFVGRSPAELVEMLHRSRSW